MIPTLQQIIASLIALVLALQASVATLPPTTQLAQVVQGSGVQYTLNDVGIQTLTYNDVSYIAGPQSAGNNLVGNAVFRAPDGTIKGYGWIANTLDNDAFHSSKSVMSSGTDYYQRIYRQDLSDSITTKIVFSAVNQNTLKVDAYITNNDSTDTLARISLGFFEPFRIPGPINSYNVNDVILAGNPINTNFNPTIFFRGDWGSVAIWPNDYSIPDSLYTYYNATTQTDFPITLVNSATNQIGNTYEDPIAPGTTKVYTTYFRFGSSSDTSLSLAPDAYSALRQASPYLVNWPDRRPIARLFIAEGTKTSATNPRGYLWDASLNVFDQANFNTRVLAWADNSISITNAMDPKPQGIMVWDFEGQEFYHYFTYVGNPPKLHDLAPEMDAIADQFFAKYTNAGYKVGMTLRPSDFQTGTTLPSTCYHDANTTELSDVFIKSDAQYPYRGYVCSATNTWTQPGAKLPYYQHMSNDDSILYNNLKAKVSYAKNRWGATIFYVDSTVYSNGTPFSGNIFRQLQKDFPDVLFFPENENLSFFGAGAPYGEINTGDWGVWTEAKYIYPEAFEVLQPFDGPNYTDPTVYNKLVQSIKDGNIMFVNGWFADTANQTILQAYRDAGTVAPPPSDTTPPSTPTNLSGTAISTSQVNLSWTASTDNVGVTGYKIYRNGAQVTTSPINSYSDTSLSPSTTYTYTVSATDAAGNLSSQSSSVSVTTQSTSLPPSTKFTPGQRVQTTSTLNVRSSASVSAPLLGTQPSGSIGAILSGGQSVDGYYWWNVNYDSGVDGWSVEDYLVIYDASAPADKFIIGDQVHATAKLKVRATASDKGKALCTQPIGAIGTVIGGPTQANGYIWWQVNYNSLCDGWSAENWLER